MGHFTADPETGAYTFHGNKLAQSAPTGATSAKRVAAPAAEEDVSAIFPTPDELAVAAQMGVSHEAIIAHKSRTERAHRAANAPAPANLTREDLAVAEQLGIKPAELAAEKRSQAAG